MPQPLRIAITPGEPAGIGPELVVRLAQQAHEAELVALADPQLLKYYANALGLELQIRLTTADAKPIATQAAEIACIPLHMPEAVVLGTLNPNNANYVLESLELANELALANKVQAIVTGPVQKSVINDAGIAFSGHTEFFAEKSATDKVVMMLATGSLRIALATTHLPLKDVPSAITQSGLKQILRILHRELEQKFAISSPRILVCGLNPHAGEGGHMGREEIDTICPVIDELRAEGMNLSDALPADTLFTPKNLENADAVLAMYHDQGLPVLKYQGFGNAVNITLGLPYIRTSVDHGTALDLAGKGIADLGSLNVALNQAMAMASASQTSRQTI